MSNLTIVVLFLCCVLITFISIFSAEGSNPSEPTKVCRDGSLYEVTHEGNITIYDRKAFMTCEEK